MKASVCSWIWVTAWKIDTTRPTIRPSASIGVATLKASVSALVARLTTTSWFMSVEALHERSGDEVPVVDQDEEQDLERQRDEDGWQHHHAHRHQRRAHDQVDDEEGEEDQEADLERGLQLRDHERGDQRVGRHVRARLRALEVRHVDEQREVLVARLAEHEVAQRLLAALDGPRLADLAGAQRVDRVLLDLGEGRRHHEDREEEGDAHEHLVGRACRRAEAGADEAEHDQDAGEARDREQQSGDQSDPREEQQELYRVAAVGLHQRTVAWRRVSSACLSAEPAVRRSPVAGAPEPPVGSSKLLISSPMSPSSSASSSVYVRIGVTPLPPTPRITTSPPARTMCSDRLGPRGSVAIVERPRPDALSSLPDLTFLRIQ